MRLYRESEPKPVIRRLAEHGDARGEPGIARENAALRRVNEVLRAASAYFAVEIDPTGGCHEFR